MMAVGFRPARSGVFRPRSVRSARHIAIVRFYFSAFLGIIYTIIITIIIHRCTTTTHNIIPYDTLLSIEKWREITPYNIHKALGEDLIY